jgi:hypothetical protein
VDSAKSYQYTYKNNYIVGAFLAAVIFIIPFYFAHINIIIQIILYLFMVWLLAALNYTHFRFTEKHIIGIKRFKPFAKFVKYSFSDIDKVRICLPSKHGRAMVVYFINSKKLTLRHLGEPIETYKFFSGKNIKVISDDPFLDNQILHFVNDPQANYQRRKLREEKQKLLHFFKRSKKNND